MSQRASAAAQRRSPGPAVFSEVPFTLTTEEADYARTFGDWWTHTDGGRSLDGRQLQRRRGTDLSTASSGALRRVPQGANEPTPITTAAQGLATLTINGNLVSYRVELSNIDSAFLAHVHHGVAGLNGPVRVNLYVPPRVPKGLDFSGLMVEDTITVPDSVLAFIRGGETYVNVHTKVNAGGEIRGQLFRFQ